MAIYPLPCPAAPHLPSPPLTGDIGAAADKLPAPPTGAMAPPARPLRRSRRPWARSVLQPASLSRKPPVLPRPCQKRSDDLFAAWFHEGAAADGDRRSGQSGRDQQPEPIIARVQAPAVLPNEVKANLAGCFVIGNATGSLAKERVEIQLVSISCVDFDEHSVVDQPVKGFFVDADGKKGLSGKVVTRAGATLARAFIAGTVSGISQSVEGTFGSTSTSALGSVRTLDAGDAAKTGIAGGLSKSSEKLTDFYLDLARQASPIVEVGAAKDVVVVIQEGVTLEIKPGAGVKF
jgi:conjugal transfer pilus assembly protein TraB